MKRLICIQLSLLFLAAAARGAEPSTSPPPQPASPSSVATEAPDTMTKPVIPPRELHFETSQDLLTLPLRDPKLLEQRYVAEFEVSPPNILLAEVARNFPAAFQNTFMFPGNPAFSASDLDRDFLSHVSDGRRPAKEIIDALRPPFVVNYPEAWNLDRGGVVPYQVFAPTPDRAKQLVQALLCLYDYGFSLRVQAGYLREKQAAVERLAKFRADLEKTKLVIGDYDKQLEELKPYNDISREALATYHAQQRVLEVDMAGVKARINACNEILERSKKPLSESRVETVETLKTTAEIELVGLAGKMSAITQIVQNGEKRLALLDKKSSSSKLASQLQSAIAGRERTIATCAEQLKLWQECPIKEGKVTIRSVKWGPAPTRRGRGGGGG
ncbi:MAG: hypothetical protein ACLP9L_30570 [Thermoguttaceae bacterium]